VFCVMVKLALFCFVVWVLHNLLDLFVNLWFSLASPFCLQETNVSFSCDFVYEFCSVALQIANHFVGFEFLFIYYVL
jgi:hypothetical protein